MISRGYAGRMLIAGDRSATARDVCVAAMLPGLAAAVALAAALAVS